MKNAFPAMSVRHQLEPNPLFLENRISIVLDAMKVQYYMVYSYLI